MKVALAQINTVVGDVSGNARRIREAWGRARASGADLVVTPELALAGYPPRDLLERPGLVRACRTALRDLSGLTREGGALLVGTVEPPSDAPPPRVHNSAVLLEGGEVRSAAHKCLLPTYDVFDEARYFEPGRREDLRPMTILGRRVGVTICEDVWNDDQFWASQRYALDPPDVLVSQGVDLLINLSASPFHLGKQDLRRRMLSHLAVDSGVPVLHCNLVGGNDDLIFDGASFAAWPGGELSHAAASFEEDVVIVDLAAGPTAPAPPPLEDDQGATEALTLGIRDYFAKCGISNAVVGLSGGIDSAVTAALAVRALGSDHVSGITMPSRWSSEGSVSDSEGLASNLGIPVYELAIEPLHRTFQQVLAPLWSGLGLDPATGGVTDQNIQARIRGTLLMAFSNRTGALVLSTGNKSELAVGYCTLYGDMAGGLAAISDLPKTRVYAVARFLNRDAGGPCIPEATITKPPSAELAPDQRDTDSLPPYDVLDAILHGYLELGLVGTALAERADVTRELAERIVRLVDRNEYKRRQAAPGLRVTPKAFGPGRRLPVAARFELG